jgi:hypothetical protein
MYAEGVRERPEDGLWTYEAKLDAIAATGFHPTQPVARKLSIIAASNSRKFRNLPAGFDGTSIAAGDPYEDHTNHFIQVCSRASNAQLRVPGRRATEFF